MSLITYLLCAGFIVSPLFTSIGNRYELQAGAGSIPGFYLLDAVKYAGRQLVLLLPLFIGHRFLSTDYGRRMLLLCVPVAILFYSPLMLFEVRMSPQLHTWVYGYFPHAEFSQTYRGGAFRPVVFLSHGLEVAMMTSLALISSLILARSKTRIGKAPAWGVGVYLSGLLLLCRSLGAGIYALLFAPLIWCTRPRIWVKVACAILISVAVYPALRTAHLIPIDSVTNAAGSVSADRSASFQARVKNEEALLAKANEKPIFGWGAWGRNLMYEAWTGKPTTVPDGQWIILFGVWGWFGYASTFLLITVCVARANRAIGREVTQASVTLGGLSLLGAICVLDLLPNSSNMVLPFLIAGTVAASAKVKTSTQMRGLISRPVIGVPAPI